jgi:hypothetical protein
VTASSDSHQAHPVTPKAVILFFRMATKRAIQLLPLRSSSIAFRTYSTTAPRTWTPVTRPTSQTPSRQAAVGLGSRRWLSNASNGEIPSKMYKFEDVRPALFLQTRNAIPPSCLPSSQTLSPLKLSPTNFPGRSQTSPPSPPHPGS